MIHKRTPWMENDSLFFRELSCGHRYELYVALQFLRAGICVESPPKTIRDSAWDIPDYADEADLWVGREDPAKIEVKSRRVIFTGPDDIPADRDPFFVTTESSWNNAIEKPLAVVLVSQDTGAMVVASPRRSEEWVKVTTRDKKRNIEDTFLCAPVKTLYTFDVLVEYLIDKEGGQ